MPWRPLLDRGTRTEALALARELGRSLATRAAPDDASLFGGHAGLAVACATLADATGDESLLDDAQRELERTVAQMGACPLPGLAWGKAGMAWAIAHLTGEMDEGFDAGLAELVGESRWTSPYELFSGLAGLLVYALDRPDDVLAAARLARRAGDRLAELAEPVAPGLAIRTPAEHMTDPDTETDGVAIDPYRLGLAHGVPGAMVALARCGRHPAVARGLATWILAQRVPASDARRDGDFASAVLPGRPPLRPSRTAWCLGDPGVATALWLASRALDDAALAAAAVDIAVRATQRDPARTGVTEATLCHGAAGLAHVYNRLYQATGEPALAEAARAWIARTLAYWQDGMAMLTDVPGLLGGRAGIALALAAAASDVEPTWDRILVLSA